MLSLNTRLDGFKFQFPREFIVDDIKEKYADILARANSFIQDPTEFLNETIKKVELLGFNNAAVSLQQQMHNKQSVDGKINTHTLSEYSYRSQVNPISLIDKTFNVVFRHTLGYVNYFMMFENFFYLYNREHNSEDMLTEFYVNVLNENGSIYSRVVLMNPVIDGIESLPMDYTLPVSKDSEFKVSFKYSNIDFQFLPYADLDKITK